MDREALRELLQALRKGRLSVAQAMEALAHLPYEQLSMAKVDHHRALRQGIPEVVLAQGKAPEDAAEIARALYARAGRVLITKASEEVFRALDLRGAKFYPRSGVIAAGARAGRKGRVVVVSAGTADAPVAEEAALTASFLGSRTQCLDDVGVAGLHRLLQHLKLLRSARALVVVAGMEGALPSVVGALVEAPVVAVPTLHRLRGQPGRTGGPAGHAQCLRARRRRGQHRQRLWRRLPGPQDKHPGIKKALISIRI